MADGRDMPHTTFVRPDLGSFCRLDELGLQVVGQRLEACLLSAVDSGVPAGTLHAIAARVPAETLTAAAPVTGPDRNSRTCLIGGRSGAMSTPGVPYIHAGRLADGPETPVR